MPESGDVRPGSGGHEGKWIEIDRRHWQDPRDGLLWQVIVWAEAEVSLSAIQGGSTDEVSVMLGFDAFHRQHLLRWTDPRPLVSLAHQEFQELLDEAKKNSRR